MNAITEFRGQHRWLSNFAPVAVTWKGETYPSVEHAYQAAKFKEPAIRDKIRRTPSPGAAKRQARLWPITTPEWDGVRFSVMESLLSQKFQHPDYAEKLLATGDAYLAEGNTWGDTYWGVCNGQGENRLGWMLMKAREALGGTGVVEPPSPTGLDDFDLELDEADDLDIDLDADLEGLG